MEHNIIVTIDGISHQLEHVPHELGCRYCSLEHFCSSGQRTNYAGLCYAFLGDDAMAYHFNQIQSTEIPSLQDRSKSDTGYNEGIKKTQNTGGN